MTAENGSDGATTPTNGAAHKTSPAAAYRKTNGHDLEGSCTALEEAMSACSTHISSDASRTTLAKARDALSKLFGAQAKLTAQIDACQKAPSEKKSLLDRCEKLEQAIEHASLELKDAVQGACVKRREAGDDAYASQQFDAAYAAYAAALGFAPDDVASLLGKARSASQLKDWQACISDARKAARLDVQSSEAHSLLVTALLEQGDVQQAAQALGNAPDDVLESSEELQVLGTDTIPEKAKASANALFQRKKFQEALALYTLAVELTDGQRHVYLSNRSACLQALSRWERAADDARRVIELKPDFAKGHLHLARSLVRLDRKLEACEVLEEGIEDGPMRRPGAFPRSCAIFMNAPPSDEIATRYKSHTGPADVSALEKLLQELRTVRPPAAPPRQQSRQLRDAATSAYKRGLYKEALSLYTKCLATDCAEADAVLANRAACWLMVDEAERAVEDCRKASSVIAEQLPKADDDERKRLVSQRSKVAARLSSSLQRLGRIDEALAVVENDPSLTEKRNQLEQCQSTQKQATEAYEGEEYSRAKRCFVKLRDDYNVTDDADARVKLAACHVRSRRPHAIDATRGHRTMKFRDPVSPRNGSKSKKRPRASTVSRRRATAEPRHAQVHLKEYADGSREALSALATKKLRGRSLVEAHGVRADALLAQGDRSRAEQHLAACLQLDPDNADIKTRLKHLRRSTKDAERIKGEIEGLVRKGEYDQASQMASEGLKVDPNDKKLTAAMHVRRAKCHQLLALKVLRSNGDRDQRQDKALPHWRRVHADSSAALYHAPSPLKTAYLLGSEALQGMHRYGDAVDLLETALNTLPDGKSDRDLVQKFKTAQRLLKKAQRPDLYKLIGPDLDEHSDESAIKKAYKKAAMRWHPDRFSCKGEKQQKEAEEQFQKINDAYEFLTDAQRKRLWDQGYDREEIEQQLEMAKQQQQYRGGGFPFGGFRRG